MAEGQIEDKAGGGEERNGEREGQCRAEGEEAETDIQVWHIDRLRDGYLYDW